MSALQVPVCMSVVFCVVFLRGFCSACWKESRLRIIHTTTLHAGVVIYCSTRSTVLRRTVLQGLYCTPRTALPLLVASSAAPASTVLPPLSLVERDLSLVEREGKRENLDYLVGGEY